MGRLKDEDWEFLRQEYEAGRKTVSEVARAARVARKTVYARMEKQGWGSPSLSIEEPDDPVDAATVEHLFEGDAGNKGNTGNTILEKVAEDRAGVIRVHQGEWHEIDRILKDAMRAYTDSEFKPAGYGEDKVFTTQDRIIFADRLMRMYNTAANALIVKQEGQRRSHGFDYKIQVKQTEVAQHDGEERRQLIIDALDALKRITLRAKGAGVMIEGEYTEVNDGSQG